MKCNLAMLSYTHAMRAKKVVNKAGFSAEIARKPATENSGCGYELKTSCSCNKAIEICRKNNISLAGETGGKK